MPLSLPNGTVCVVVRHGRTTLNASNSFRGNVDPELDSVGIKQAEDLAKLLSDTPLSVIFTSDKQRATKTAEIIAKGREIPVRQVACLRALDVGQLSGQKRTPENVAFLQHYLDHPECQIPGGESLNEFRARVDPCLQSAVELFMQCGVPPMVVAHSSVVREVGTVIYGSHKKVLVEPGGAVVICFQNGVFTAQAIHRPMVAKSKTDTIS